MLELRFDLGLVEAVVDDLHVREPVGLWKDRKVLLNRSVLHGDISPALVFSVDS